MPVCQECNNGNNAPRFFFSRPHRDNYGCGALALIYHLHIAVSSARGRGVAVSEVPCSDLKLNAIAIFAADSFDHSDLSLRDEELVFVGNVEVMDEVKGVPIPSLVRLYLVEHFPAHCEEGFMFFSLVEERFQILSGWSKGKLNSAFLGGISGCQFKPSVIESGREIMYCVPQDERKLIRDAHVCRDDLQELVSGIRIALDGNLVSATIAEPMHLKAEIVDVLFGPFEF